MRTHVRSRIARLTAVVMLCVLALSAAEHKGKVQFNGVPVPGAAVKATQGDRVVTAVTDENGNYMFEDLPDGMWNFQVDMSGFAPIQQDVTIAGTADIPEWDLKMLPLDQIKTTAAAPPPPRISVSETQETPQTTAQNTAPASSPKSKGKANAAAAAGTGNGQSSFQRADVNANPNAAPASDVAEATPANSPFASRSAADASDGLLINGTTNNGASSPFAQAASFGNNRRGPGSLYNGNLAIVEDNSALDANSFSYTGQPTPKPEYDHMQVLANVGGPIRIPHLITNGPQFFINYQRLRNHTAQTNSYDVPTAEERAGNFAGGPAIWDPTSGAPFQNNMIPLSRISPQALALMSYFPQPNLIGSSLYNYQIPIVGETHQDALRAQLNKNIGNRNNLYGYFAFQRQAVDNPNEFGFLDKTNQLGMNTQMNWQHRFSQRLFAHLQLQFSRFSNELHPYWAGRQNVSGNAGVTGNDQDPLNWGPPALNFQAISPLSDGIASTTHNQTMAYTYDSSWSHGRHELTWGGDYKRQEFNAIGQQNPRGAFTFTGAYTAPPGSETSGAFPALGSDFADFLLGVPDTASIGFGNADKYFRDSLYDVFFGDNWRVGPALTINAGLRWDYQAPIKELYGRLVNLDVTGEFASIAPEVQSMALAAKDGVQYNSSLLHPDYTEFSPRVSLAWRPIPASSLVVRAGYGIGYNTSVYQQIAQQMAVQPPLSTTLSISNTPGDPLTLARGFVAPPNVVTNTFGIDPNFRIGYAQTWQASVQRDLPGSLVMIATYLGIKGTRGPQEFLPNTYPEGVASPCAPACPSGFIYMTSNGNSEREAGSFQLRRRLHNGFLASATYTYAKAIDDSALGGRGQGTQVVAQNWLNLSAERALSNFDQRHTLALQAQYTTGQGIGGGTLLNGWRGALFKEWTVATTVNLASGMPLTPFLILPTPETGVTSQIRPDYTGASLFSDVPAGYEFNPAAFTPASGTWGNAGRNIITGPMQFTLNGSLGRTFRLKDRYSLDLRFDATNAINHVTFASWNTNLLAGAQFGLPTPPANAMRDITTTVRLRF